MNKTDNYKNKKNIAVIPARGGSKRFPGKNTVNLCGKPLIAHSIEYALKNENILQRIIVSTDSPEIEKVALKYGAEVIIRPEFISGDHTPTIEVIKHVVEELDDPVDDIFLLQPTSPLRPLNLLKRAYEVYKSGNQQSLFTVTRSLKKFGKISNGLFVPENYSFGQRSQDMEHLFYENGLLYISSSSIIRKDKLIDEKAIPFEISHVFGEIDIDTTEDLLYAEFLYRKFYE